MPYEIIASSNQIEVSHQTFAFSVVFVYTSGMTGSVWFILWMLLVWETPAAHPRISQAERRYIEESLGESLIKKSDPQVFIKL